MTYYSNDYESEENIDKVLKECGFEEVEIKFSDKEEVKDMTIHHLLNSIGFTVKTEKIRSYRKMHIYKCIEEIRKKLRVAGINERV